MPIDAAYFCEKSYDHMIVTAWVPFLDTNEQNGGMQVSVGGNGLHALRFSQKTLTMHASDR